MRAIYITAVGLTCILIPFLVLRMGNMVDDSVVRQWGFFHYNASLQGLIYLPGSLLNNAIMKAGIEIKLMKG